MNRDEQRAVLARIRQEYMNKGYEDVNDGPVIGYGNRAHREQFENRPDQPYTLAALPLQDKRPRRLGI